MNIPIPLIRRLFSRTVRHVLACFWRLRQRRTGGGLPRDLALVSWASPWQLGLTVLTMAFAIGHISGCHLNPAVSIGLAIGKRFPAKELPAYILARSAGDIAGAGVLYGIASGKAGFDVSAGFASNGYGAHSPGYIQ